MTPQVFHTYVVMHGNEYCRFGSYRTVEMVSSPLKATHYSRLSDARKRIEQTQTHWLNNRTEILPVELRVVRIRMSLLSEELAA